MATILPHISVRNGMCFKLPPKIIVLLAVVFGLVACSSTKDITRNPTTMTDFVVGDVYRLKRAGFLLNDSSAIMPLGILGSSTNADEARHNLPLQVDAFVEPNTLLRVQKIVLSRNFMVGRLTDIYAEIIDGSLRGRVVNLRTISKDDWNTGYTALDSEQIERIK